MSRRIPITPQLTVDATGHDFRDAVGTPILDPTGVRELVTAIKRARGWSSAQLGEVIDADSRSVRRWLAGDASPETETRETLVRLLDGSPSTAAEDPVVLAMITARLLPGDRAISQLGAHELDQVVSDARTVARAVDRGVAAERRLREMD